MAGKADPAVLPLPPPHRNLQKIFSNSVHYQSLSVLLSPYLRPPPPPPPFILCTLYTGPKNSLTPPPSFSTIFYRIFPCIPIAKPIFIRKCFFFTGFSLYTHGQTYLSGNVPYFLEKSWQSLINCTRLTLTQKQLTQGFNSM